MSEQRGGGLADYASPILRAAVFRQLNPDAHITYTIVPIGQAFPEGHQEYEGKATEAVRCEIVWPDGRYVTAFKEIDKVDRGRTRAQTPEELAKDETKALGRALRDCGIPQRLTELKLLMQWIASMSGAPLAVTNVTNVEASTFGADDESGDVEDDSPDAGSEPTVEQVLAERFSRLNGADKAAVFKHATELGVKNVMRAGEHAEALLAYIESYAWLKDTPDDAPQAPPPAEPERAKVGSRAGKHSDKEEPF